MVNAILRHDIMPGMTVEEYERWLTVIRIPDLSKMPGLRKVVLNTVKGEQSASLLLSVGKKEIDYVSHNQ